MNSCSAEDQVRARSLILRTDESVAGRSRHTQLIWRTAEFPDEVRGDLVDK